ncbi:MAG: hypothetical protein BEN19_04885 [Epulopiscium sp. Nuni2H_MBin003]|nr:MAG: hypothetical protein BEN19_04885 [Epulopiscium sp. Nuni2H_MBin003]
MYNNKKRISASEVNRFTYCPYSWYYNRVYGQKEIYKRYKNSGVQYPNSTNNFIKGNKFHKKYHVKYQVVIRVQIIILLILAYIGYVL